MLPGPTTENEEKRLYSMTNPDELKIGMAYNGPHIHFPMTTLQLQNLISAFKGKQVWHMNDTHMNGLSQQHFTNCFRI